MAEFVDTPENPAPAWGKAETLVARDGLPIRYGLFPAQSGPRKGSVIILTGRNECIEKYFETIRDLSDRGFGSAIMDWRGQGGSGRMLRNPQRGYVRSFDQYAADLEQFLTEVVLADCRPPYYLLAHSTGAVVALMSAPALLNRVNRMVLIAPLIELSGQPLPQKWIRRLTGLLRLVGLGSLYVSGGARPKGGYPFADNKLTTDVARFTRNNAIYDAAPQLSLGGPTVAWIHAASVAADRIRDPDLMGSIHLPALMIAAGADEVVDTGAVEAYARRLRSGSLLTIDGARHEILQEADVYREQFWAAFDAFIPGEDPDALAGIVRAGFR